MLSFPLFLLEIPKMEATIQTPLLRLFFAFYACLGFSFISLQPRRCLKILSFNWNCLTAICNLYSCLFGDPSLYGELFHKFNLSSYAGKPLLKALDQFVNQIAYPLAHYCILLHFTVYGLQIVRLLDGQLMRQVYTSIRHTRWIFAVIIFFLHLDFAFALWSLLEVYIQLRHILSISYAFNWLYIYTVYCFFFLPPGIVHYAQYGILQTLKGTVEQLSILSTEETFKRVMHCVTFNRQLNKLLSFPLMVYILLSTLNATGK